MVHLDVQQNLDEVLLVVVHLDVLHPLVVVVGVELRHLLRMDYFLDEVGVELRHPQRMDCCQDVEQLVHPVVEVLEQLELQVSHRLVQLLQLLRLPALLREMP